MFQINDDLSIYVTRGDMCYFTVTTQKDGKPYTFQVGEVLRFNVCEKKNCDKVVLQKDFPVTEVTQRVEIVLDGNDTKFGGVISKPVDYWYEVVLNPFDFPQTVIGYDDEGTRVFRLFPEANDKPAPEPKPEVIKVIDTELDMTSERPVQNQAIARAFYNLQAGYEATHAAVAALHVTPEMFGAIGDGKADDTEALKAAMSHTGRVFLNGQYRISERIMCNCSEIEGNNSTLIAGFTSTGNEDVIRFADVHNVKITNLTIDGNNGNMRYGICVLNAENVTLDNIDVHNVRDMNNTTSSDMIALYNCTNVSANRINISYCYKLCDGNIDSGGGAIYGFYSAGYNRLTIVNSNFLDIHNINNSGGLVIEDAAAIYVKTGNRNATTLIENVSGYNTGKRFIKSQNAGIVKIDAIKFINTSKDFLVGVATMYSADALQIEPATTTITNSYLENSNGHNAVESFLIGANDNVIVSDCVLNAKSGSALIFTKDDHIKSDFIKITNCEITGNLFYTYTAINNITFNNCHIKTSCLLYKANNETGEFVKFIGCHIEICDDYYDTYTTFAFSVGSLIFNNCELIDASQIPIEVKNCEKLIINGCRITINRALHPFYVYNDVELSNTTIINGVLGGGRLMQMMDASAHVYIKNIDDAHMTFTVFSTAFYHIGENVNIGKLATYPGLILECVPSYNSGIEKYNIYNIADGALFIDKNDGRLYRLDKSLNVWLPVV